jgi:hypothetical protein
MRDLVRGSNMLSIENDELALSEKGKDLCKKGQHSY